MKHQMIKVLLPLTLSCMSITFTPYAKAQEQKANIALHQKVTVDPPSNYSLTKDKNSAQLTDGIYASTNAQWDATNRTSSLWVQRGALTWVHRTPVIITIDLGSVQPISGVSYSTAAGAGGATWPTAVYLATSDDNKTWHYAGDLVALSQKEGTPSAKGYANFRYVTHDLKTKGRYISFGVVAMPSITVDEIEVYRGDDALLKQSAGREIPTMKAFVAQQEITSKARRRLNEDIDSIRSLLKKAKITPSLKSTFEARLLKDAAATLQMPYLPADFKTIIPLNDIHRDILAVHGEVLAAQGFSPLTIWKKQRYAWLPLINTPDKKQAASLHISMLKNQFRSDAFLLTNASGEPMTIKVQLQNPPKDTKQGWLQLSSAIWTDTLQGVPVQDALIPLDLKNNIYSMNIPAGVTGKLWVTVDSSKVLSGAYKSTFTISSNNQHLVVPFDLNISTVKMDAPRLSVAVWEYTNGNGHLAITPQNRAAAIKLLRSHFMNTPWATNNVLPTPTSADFDAENQLKTKLDFSELDQWIAMWPDAQHYFVAYDVKNTDTFAGAELGTSEYNAKVGSWIKAIATHFVKLGLKPSQLFLAPADESHTDETDLRLIHFSKAIKNAVPEIGIWADPTWPDPRKAKNFEAFTIPDILCSKSNKSQEAYEFYNELKRDYNKDLWLYSPYSAPNGSLGDPQLSYRQMAWRVFAIGGNGEGFWAFADTGKVPTSWNAYSASRAPFTPVYIDTDTVYSSIHWDAMREGVEDFEELSMLANAIKESKNNSLRMQAQKVLDDTVKTVNSDIGDNKEYQWSQQTDPFMVDAQLQKVRMMLQEFPTA